MASTISDLYAVYYDYYGHPTCPTKLTLNPRWKEVYAKLSEEARAGQLHEWKKFVDCDVEFSESEPDFRFT